MPWLGNLGTTAPAPQTSGVRWSSLWTWKERADLTKVLGAGEPEESQADKVTYFRWHTLLTVIRDKQDTRVLLI
ncbi:hypothetical protein T4D_16956 [Trichinella pseudospiralis]|uniref:Uncharacterized protein n=1 Tax=Trichinella pseudospiralis TaxID=6337 RepID=A0A0V1G4R9_TRIPS|nr:hypothetical protein T4D_16956 [Trichinella pseudospiralis]